MPAGPAGGRMRVPEPSLHCVRPSFCPAGYGRVARAAHRAPPSDSPTRATEQASRRADPRCLPRSPRKRRLGRGQRSPPRRSRRWAVARTPAPVGAASRLGYADSRLQDLRLVGGGLHPPPGEAAKLRKRAPAQWEESRRSDPGRDPRGSKRGAASRSEEENANPARVRSAGSGAGVSRGRAATAGRPRVAAGGRGGPAASRPRRGAEASTSSASCRRAP